MMYVLTFILGLVVGGCFGFVFMCLLQANRSDYDLDDYCTPGDGKENEP